MSQYGYDDDPRRRGSRYDRDPRVRDRDREPAYVTERYVERQAPVRELVYRPREDSIEDIPRDFPPPNQYRGPRHRETYGGPRSSRGYDDDYYSDHGYSNRDSRPKRNSRRDDGYYSDDSRPRRERRKSIGDSLKDLGEGLGLGGIVGSVAGRSRSRSRSRRRSRRDDRYSHRDSRYGSSSRSRSRDRDRRKDKKWEQAAKAAVVAGAVEAFRSRKEPGPWNGEKGQRIATAALGAAGIDQFTGSNSGNGGVAGSALGGLLANRVANGPRDRSGSRGRSMSRSRSRSRSIFGRSKSRGRNQSRGGSKIGDVAGAGAVLAAGKALYDRVRSKSRKRQSRSRSRSVSSDDSYVPSRGRRNMRPRELSRDDFGPPVAGAARGGALGPAADGIRKRDSSSDSQSTTDMENERKKMRGKELITAGLATVATIHAAHGVYSSMVASEKRRKLVSEGEMDPAEARRLKSKNMLQDAASVGIAALGIKSAFGEWKEMNEQRHHVHDLEKKRAKRRKLKERREREFQQSLLMGAPAYPPVQYGEPNPYGGAQNPYAAGAVPPPPLAPSPNARY